MQECSEDDARIHRSAGSCRMGEEPGDSNASGFDSETVASRADREAALRTATEYARELLCCCLHCGRTLGFLDMIAGRNVHGHCDTFARAPGKGEILMYCKFCEQVTWGTSSENTDAFGSSRITRKCGQCHLFE